jgi:hypothetical protein
LEHSSNISKIIGKAGIQDTEAIREYASENGDNRKPLDFSWNINDFPILWSRIVKLKEYQDNIKPTTWWALWRDRRNPVQYYGTMQVISHLLKNELLAPIQVRLHCYSVFYHLHWACCSDARLCS